MKKSRAACVETSTGSISPYIQLDERPTSDTYTLPIARSSIIDVDVETLMDETV